jgi:NADH-quinone oxidoreductase subunit N
MKGALWLVAIGALNVVTSLYYYLKIVKVMYVDEPPAERANAKLEVSFDTRVMQYFVMAGILAMGLYPGPFVRLAQSAYALF